jgi:hypothetical protein
VLNVRFGAQIDGEGIELGVSDPLVMMVNMFQTNGSTIECATCVATGTSACSECIVTFVLANDAGPIDYVPTPVALRAAEYDGSVDRAVALLVSAGLVDHPVEFVSVDEFEGRAVPVGAVGS